MHFVTLKEVAQYSTERVGVEKLTEKTYVGVDNMLAEKRGIVDSQYVPAKGGCVKFSCGDVLIGNIRPYLKKIWLADRDGGTNGDVLAIKPNREKVLPQYLYQLLASDRFFAFDEQHSKGSKMPRGNKDKVMEFKFALPSLQRQKEVVEVLGKFEKLCNDLTDGLPAEIIARKKQYEYYRDELLSFGKQRTKIER